MEMYSFDKVIDRHRTGCFKWDNALSQGVLPMHVADMDFEIAPAIQDAIKKRANHGVFGYTQIMPEYFESVKSWNARRHHYVIDESFIVPVTAVMPAIAAILRALCNEHKNVLLQQPVYDCFFKCIENNRCSMFINPLIYDKDKNRWIIDFDDFEQKIVSNDIHLFILCNPHNPVGRVWLREELERIADICIKHHVYVISDEIHCDIVMPGYSYVPFASISPEVEKIALTCTSPSKPFNIAGLQIANLIIADESIRQRVMKELMAASAWLVNPFGVLALQAAYNESEDWLEQCILYIYNNYKIFNDFCANHLSGMALSRLEGTYLAWLDCSILNTKSDLLFDELYHNQHLKPCPGQEYGMGGEYFLRFNLACPKNTLLDGLQRLKQGLDKFR